MFIDMTMGPRIAAGQTPALRAVFRKTHAIVVGVFEQAENLPAELCVGLFAQQSASAIVRFSSDCSPRDKDAGQTIGVAIKLLPIPGTKLLHPDAVTCDFVLQNHPVFFVDNATEMCAITRAALVDGSDEQYIKDHPKTAQILRDMAKTESSLLEAKYFGILPHSFGPGRYVKYHLRPVVSKNGNVAPVSTDLQDYLYLDLKSRLLAAPAKLQLFVQIRSDPESMPLDEATVEWSDELSPPILVGTLKLPAQNIDAPGLAQYGENLSFNIWQTLPEHEPVGSIALARRAIYAAGAEVRRTHNQVPQDEPSELPSITPPNGASEREIVRAAIHPAIGIARVGNSKAPGEQGYFVGPESPGAEPMSPGEYKDVTGALRRQAARFRIYGYNAKGEVVGELTPDQAAIAWTVHVANKKAAWYQFQLALDIPEASAPTAPPSRRRNAQTIGPNRAKLTIDPGSRTIHGRDTFGSSWFFDTGTFFDTRVPLGALRTDHDGRLLVLGGYGLSRSAVNQPPQDFANNDGWHDDVSDGPVTATVVINGKTIPVEGAWVIVAPPNYAPGLRTVRSLWDLLLDLGYQWGWVTPPQQVSFRKHIWPIFERLSELQWVNAGFAAIFGAGAPYDPVALKSRLGDASLSNQEFRQQILSQFRDPRRKHLGRYLWPPFYGDALDSMDFTPPAPGTDDPTLSVPASLSSLSRKQIADLQRWANGLFVSDLDAVPQEAVPIEKMNIEYQPAALDQAALEHCLADAFHPGCEVTWPIRQQSLYRSFLRINRRADGVSEPDLGEVLSPGAAASPAGPLSSSGPGDLTRWMAVPWQTDTASCLSGYPFFKTTDSLPSFWPARVPNQILREEEYNTLMDPTLSQEERRRAFQQRHKWYRVFDQGNDLELMLSQFDKLGLVERRPGPSDLRGFPRYIWVETKPALPDPASAPPIVAATTGPTGLVVQPRRRTLRKFGRNRT
jgi:hypothetical protein